MDIKLIPEGKTANQFVFALLPEEIMGGDSAKYQSYSIISRGDVKIPKGRNVKEISWDGVFFGESKKDEYAVKTEYWMEPNQCVEILENWMENGTVLNLIVTDTWINVDVTISSFKPVAYGAYGNIRYSIEFVEARDLKVYTTNDLKISSSKSKSKKKKVKSRNALKKRKSKKYVIKQSDTMYKIALSQRGLGSDWMLIYNKNKDVIEKAAMLRMNKTSNRGEFLVAGTEIVIP